MNNKKNIFLLIILITNNFAGDLHTNNNKNSTVFSPSPFCPKNHEASRLAAKELLDDIYNLKKLFCAYCPEQYSNQFITEFIKNMNVSSAFNKLSTTINILYQHSPELNKQDIQSKLCYLLNSENIIEPEDPLVYTLIHLLNTPKQYILSNINSMKKKYLDVLKPDTNKVNRAVYIKYIEKLLFVSIITKQQNTETDPSNK